MTGSPTPAAAARGGVGAAHRGRAAALHARRRARARRRMARRASPTASRARRSSSPACRKPARCNALLDGPRRRLALSLGSRERRSRPLARAARSRSGRSISQSLLVRHAPCGGRGGRSRGDAAAAPHEGGGGAADRARRHRRRLAGRCGSRARSPSSPTRRSRARCAFCCASAADAGQAQAAPIRAEPEEGSGYIVLAMGKMGAYELNYSSDIDLIVLYDPDAPALADDVEPGRALRAHHARPGEAAAGAHRRRLCVPRRSAAAARSGLDPDRGLDDGGARTTTRASARTGSAPR